MVNCAGCDPKKKQSEEPANYRAQYDYHGRGGTLWLVSTRTCNFACKYCYQGADHSWKDWQKNAGLVKTMTDEVVEKALNFSKDFARNSYGKGESKRSDFMINWYGGEPLLTWELIKKWTPRFYEELQIAGRKVKVGVTTNGSLLDAEKREFFDEYKMGVLFSIDGPPWLHNNTRVLAGGKPSWDKIPVKEIIAWRPKIEIAWQITPGNVPEPGDLDYMRGLGFENMNFNLNWLEDWSMEDQKKLTDFMYYAMRLAVQTSNGKLRHPFRSNWFSRIEKLVRGAGVREPKPCGTGLGMLAVTPEGWLYPSQEMAFSVFEPTRANGTAEYYKVGNLFQDPIMADETKLEKVFNLYNDDMIPPAGFDCNTCAIRAISFGGCHCRYVGQDGVDPSNRYQVAPGWCKAQLAAATGGLLAFAREGYVRISKAQKSSAPNTQSTNNGLPKKPLSIVDLDRKLDRIINILEK